MDQATSVNITRISYGLEVYYWEQVLIGIFIGLIAVLGIMGNSMILLAVSFSLKLQTSTNAFVTSLSIADLITSFFLIFYMISVLGRNGWPIPQAQWLCAFTAFMMYMCRGTSLYTMAAIAINRLLLITKPSLYKRVFVSHKLVICVAVPWIIVSGTIFMLLAIGFSVFGYDDADLACAIDDSHEKAEAVSLLTTLVAFPIPLLITSVCYLKIYIYLRKHFKAQKGKLGKVPHAETSTDEPNRSSVIRSSMITDTPSTNPITKTTGQTVTTIQRKKRISQKQIEITKNLFMVVCSLYLCFLPYFILIHVPNSKQKLHVVFYTRIITIANSTINFAIYAGKHPDFKIVFGHIMRRSFADIPQPSRFLKFVLSLKYRIPFC